MGDYHACGALDAHSQGHSDIAVGAVGVEPEGKMSRTWVPTDVRRLVRQRAHRRCEYCLSPEELSFVFHQVDHIVSEKHEGLTVESNLALCCIACNQFKGTDLSSLDPLTGEITPLFNPRKHSWPDHFRLAGRRIEPLSPIGRTTARLLHFNDPERLTERELFILAGFFAEHILAG